ncbi:LacI family DNA-binding transcriptional regulator [Flexithrix dorotheae]|uniref:LacI family DNA-binding transcriptional regulator n=1 Tax=Flexithrix dorotheae TaxID=70993 RepID=UPI00037DAA7B|nr:LacI family DNA-binding transcriptional regulator [Flexithrix dorotheae]
MKSSKKRLIDIARELKVSTTTVSRALNGNPKVGEATRKAIVDLAKEWDYRPNIHALSLKKKETHALGLIIPEFTHYFFSLVMNGIEDIANKAGYHLMICTSKELYEKEKKATQMLSDSMVDGFLIAPAIESEDFAHFHRLKDDGYPIVFFDRNCEDLECPYVITDDFDGANQAVNYLISSGCKNILHLKGPESLHPTFTRFMGYRNAHKKNGLEIKEANVLKWQNTEQERKNQIKEILKNNNSIDGIFAYNDYVAYEAVEVCLEMGIKMPDQLSIMGYADEPVASYITPKLSTVKQPAFEMGKHAAELLLELLRKSPVDEDALHPIIEEKEVKSEMIKTSLVLRETTRKV